MNKTKIEWADYVWNPIKGLCPVGCWYCYARNIYRRFKIDPTPRLEISGGTPDLYSESSRIFVCSTFELFHPTADQWRDEIFMHIIGSKHTFIILTKMPERIDRPMPDNVWLGTSVPGMDNISRIGRLLEKAARIKFISFEPLLDFPAVPASGINWIIIGKLTGHGKKYDPPREWIEELVGMAHGLTYPVFLKNNLKEIWGEPLIQEWPE